MRLLYNVINMIKGVFMKKIYLYNYKFNSVFLRTFIILVLSSIIPVLAANTIINKQATSTFQKQICDTNINMLGKTSETVDLTLKQVEQTIQQLAKDRNVVNFIINPEINLDFATNFTSGDNNITRNSKIISNLQNISASNNHIHSVYIYSNYNSTILSSCGGAFELKDFSDKEWKEDYDNYIQDSYQVGTRQVTDIFGNSHNLITLIKNLPYSSSSKQGAIIINISEDKLYHTIAGLDAKYAEEIYVIKDDGYILSHKDKNMINRNLSHYPYFKRILEKHEGFFIEKVNGEKMLFTYETSSYNRWKYVYAIPLKSLQNDSTIISRIILIITFIYIVLALILSFFVSREIYHPIKKLMNLVLGSSKQICTSFVIKNEYEFLGYAYSDVLDKNKNMETIVQNAKPIIKEKLFTNLIMGKCNDSQEIFDKISMLNIKFSQTDFIVIAIQIDGYNEFRNKFDEMDRNLYKIKLVNMIEKIICSRYHGVCVEIESDKAAVVINFTNYVTLMQEKEILLEIVEKIKAQVQKNFPFTITLGIGRMYKDIINVKLSYNEAINALKYKLYHGKNKIINIDDIEVRSKELYYYDSEKEKMLINNLKVGQKKEIEILISELVQEILEHRSYPYTYVQQVFIRIINSIVEQIINKGMDIEEIFGSGYNLYEELSNRETIDDIKIWLSEICYTTINAINAVNLTKSQKNAEKILEYIDENLSHDISLNDIADWIGFSPSYVSKVFKENIGKSYTDYLNGSRIEMAKKLLRNTQLTIKEVGFRMGFNSIQTFMRTFKKYEGITPGQFRDKI